MTTTNLKTPLTEKHEALGARMTDFAGWWMPLQYKGVREEHEAVRTHGGLFDLSHMAEIVVTGEQREDFVQTMVTNDLKKLNFGQAMYSCLCNLEGRIIDDLLVYRFENEVWIVANASNRSAVVSWLEKHAEGMDVALDDRTEEIALVAVQGPAAEAILQPHVDGLDLSTVDFYTAQWGTVGGQRMLISRTGYTGEDGFELYVENSHAGATWDLLLQGDEALVPVGLAARDTLRLESGFALYGNELSLERSPYDVTLAWITKLDKEPAPLAKPALEKAKESATTCLVGLTMEGRGVPRAGYPVHQNGTPVGFVSSGTFSPSLKKGVALAIVERSARAAGTELEIIVRGKPQAALVTKLPFVRGSVKRHS
ncbi:MAG TPA: glycine cleavage system aminomethyltransferase GcvT [Phycisphaerales bacterium]|nr:glycine cleavage system aminomethyltransferase GcvT [Phycisphaerales bacterium]